MTRAVTAPLPVARCDFCARPLSGRHVQLRTTAFTRVAGNGGRVQYQAGWWAACHGCVPLVRGRRWCDLATRALEVRLASDPAGWRHEHLLRGELVALWMQFEHHFTGQERPGRIRRRAAG